MDKEITQIDYRTVPENVKDSFKELKKEDLTNLLELDSFSFTYAEIEDQIRHYQLDFYANYNNPVVEALNKRKNGLPIFLVPFYDSIARNGVIPTQKTHWDLYQTQNSVFFNGQNEEFIREHNQIKNGETVIKDNIWFTGNKMNEDIRRGIERRCRRAYPSFVRDIHFSKFLKSKLTNTTVVYDTYIDLKRGIDILLIHNEKFYGLKIYTNTPEGNLQAEDKTKNRINEYANVKYVPVISENRGSIKVGRFDLLSNREYQQVLEKIPGLNNPEEDWLFS